MRLCPVLALLLLAAPARAATTPPQREAAQDWNEIQTFLSTIKGVITNPPERLITDKFTSGMLLGNGDIGVVAGPPMPSGATNEASTLQKFYFGKGNFLGQAMDLTRNDWTDSILPIGALTIGAATIGQRSPPGFRMEQDILHAQVGTREELGQAVLQMNSWVAAGDNVFVTEITNASARLPVALAVRLLEDPSAAYPHSSGVTNGLLWVSRENDDRTGYKARVVLALNVIGARFNQSWARAADATATFTLQPGARATLVVAVKGDGAMGTNCAGLTSLEDAALRGAAELSPALFAKLRDVHLQWWKDYWLRSCVRVFDPVLEKYYYGALYVMGSAARPGKLLPSMWGMWMTTQNPRWGGRHFFNYNAQGPYYGVASANRPELILPYSEFVSAELPYEVNRTHAAGYQGATFKRSMMPFSVFRGKPEIIPVAAARDWTRLPTDQKSNGSFAAMPMIMYYEYTRDANFLTNKLYHLLKELDAFWRDYMEKEQLTNGGYRYVIRHSGAHEFAGAAAAVDVNPDLDLGFIRTGCRILISASTELGVDADLRPAWQDVLDHLSAYPTRVENGKELFTNEEVRNRIDMNGQPVNMEGAVHPGENVTLGGDPHLIQVGLDTIAYMQPWGLGRGSANNGFCKEWLIMPRLDWPADDFIAKFKAAILYLWRESNLTCFQGGGGIETCGAIDAIDAMLLQSNFGELRLFPVWPRDKDAYFKRLRAKGAFLVSSEFKNGEVTHIDVVSEKGLPLKIINPWPGAHVLAFDVSGRSRRAITPQITDTAIALATAPGKRYYFAPAMPNHR